MEGKRAGAIARKAIALAWLMGSMGFAHPAWAGSFSVDPVHIGLPDGQRATSVTVRNGGTAPVSIRAEALAWTQVNGDDRYAATDNVIVSPPIFTIAPGATQLLRVGVKDRGRDQAYRLILQEIPAQKRVAGQVQVVLRLNLPVYLLPHGSGRADVSWTASRSAEGTVTVEGHNAGSLYEQVTGLIAEQAGKSVPISNKMGVILPGSWRRWTSRTPVAVRPGEPVTLHIKTPSGEAQTRIPLEPR